MRPPSDLGKTTSSVANWPIVRPQKSKRAKGEAGQIRSQILANFEQKGPKRGRTYLKRNYFPPLILSNSREVQDIKKFSRSHKRQKYCSKSENY
jgi:hypothetical protein